MALTYAQLTSYLQDQLQQYDTTLTADLAYIVRQAEDSIHKSVFMSNYKKTQTSTMTGGNRFLNTPDDFVAPLVISVVVGGAYSPLLAKEMSALYEMYPNPSSTGQPKYYALFDDDALVLGPTPDQGYQTEFQYFYKPTSLADVAAGQTTWLSQNAEHTLFYACLVEALRFQKAEQDIYIAAMQEYKSSLNDLRKVVEGMDEGDAFRRNEIKIPVMTMGNKN